MANGMFDLRRWHGNIVRAIPAVIQRPRGYEAALVIGEPDETTSDKFLGEPEIVSDVDKLFEDEDGAMAEAEEMLERFAQVHGVDASKYIQ